MESLSPLVSREEKLVNSKVQCRVTQELENFQMFFNEFFLRCLLFEFQANQTRMSF